jgi:hypothetical protein
MEKEDIFKFGDFINGDKFSDLQKMKSELVKEGLFSDREGYSDEENDDSGIFAGHIQRQDGEEDEEINQEFNPYKVTSSSEVEDEEDDIHLQHRNMSFDDENLEFDFVDENEFNEVDEDDDLEDLGESKSNTEEYYKLFKDKAEDFVCDIAVEGVNNNDTEVRLIVESEDWTLMFIGEIKNGKCIIPIKKLNILNEGQTGNIKLEVNADGNLFTPWEDKFVVKMSKKVTVKLNESINKKKPIKKGLGVKVNVIK